MIIEPVLATVVAGAIAIWSERMDNRALLTALLSHHRSDIYGLLLSSGTGLLGFTLTVVTVIQTLLVKDVFKRVKDSNQNQTLWKIFTRAARVFGVLVAASLVALLVDRDDNPSWAPTYLVIWVVLLGGVYLARTLWVVERMVALNNDP